MKVDPVKFEDLFRRASVWSGSEIISPVLVEFDDGIQQSQFNQGRTILSIIRAQKGYFKEYEDIGEIQISPSKLMKFGKSLFDIDKEISLSVKEDGEKKKLVLQGKRDTNAIKLADEELRLPDETPVVDDIGRLDRMNVNASYLVSSNEIKKVSGIDVYHFQYGEESLKFEAQEEIAEMERKLKIREEKFNNNGSTRVNSELFDPCLSQFSGNVWIHFGNENEVVLAQAGSDILWAYLIAGMEIPE